MIWRTTLLAGTLGLGGDYPGGRRTSPLERRLEGEGYRVGPPSTAIDAPVWNALVAEVAYLRTVAGTEPSFFASRNVPGGDGANEALVSRYRSRNRFYG